MKHLIVQRSSRQNRLALFAWILIVAFWSRGSFQPIHALPDKQDVETTELRSSVDYSFGQVMRFNLAASGVGDIEAVTLFFRVGTSPDSFAVEVPIEAGQRVETSYVLDLTQTRLPPFAPITYWWVVQRTDGSAVRVPEQVLSYVDDQFNWRQVVQTDEMAGGSIRVHYTGEDETLGEQAMSITLDMLQRIGPRLPLDMVLPFDVYIYPSSADLGAALRLAGREYEPGETYPDLGVILAVVVNPETAELELRKEISRGLVDLLLYQAMGSDAADIPAWLRQGLIASLQGTDDPATKDLLQTGVVAGTIRPLSELCAAEEVLTDLDVAQSNSVVNFIVTAYGADSLRKLTRAFADGNDCATAFVNVFSMSPDQFGETWLRAESGVTGERPTAAYAVWGVLLIGGFGLAALLMRRPRRA